MEDLQAEPDQLLSFHFWAQDIGPDGQPRKTYSDMYFAEVRPFDEIYRSSPSPPGGQSQPQGDNAQQSPSGASEQLAELQKQIINGTWNLQRQVGIRSKSETWSNDANRTTAIPNRPRLTNSMRSVRQTKTLPQRRTLQPSKNT